MRLLAITPKGMEDICLSEVSVILDVDKKLIETGDYVIISDIKDVKDICKLCYISQSSIKVLFLFDAFEIGSSLDDTLNLIREKIKKINIQEWLDKDDTFMVKCKRIGIHGFKSRDVEENVGHMLIDHMKREKNYLQKVDLKNPDLIFFIFINNDKCYLGIDFSGFDLSKRDYKIFNISGSLKGTIAYALVKLSDFKNYLLEPLTRDGIFSIESALMASNFPVNYYKKKDFAFLKLRPLKGLDFDDFFNDIDKKIKNKIKQKIYCYSNDMRNVQAARKNAKVAGIQKLINFGKVDLEWLDTKFKENEINSIIAVINFPKESRPEDNKKLCNEFFYQSEFVLNKKGKLVIVSNNMDLIKESSRKYNFKILEERSIFTGKKELKVVVFGK